METNVTSVGYLVPDVAPCERDPKPHDGAAPCEPAVTGCKKAVDSDDACAVECPRATRIMTTGTAGNTGFRDRAMGGSKVGAMRWLAGKQYHYLDILCSMQFNCAPASFATKQRYKTQIVEVLKRYSGVILWGLILLARLTSRLHQKQEQQQQQCIV